MGDTCRMMGCDSFTSGSKFCSTYCELKFEHIREDARQARAGELEEYENEQR